MLCFVSDSVIFGLCQVQSLEVTPKRERVLHDVSLGGAEPARTDIGSASRSPFRQRSVDRSSKLCMDRTFGLLCCTYVALKSKETFVQAILTTPTAK